MGYENLTFKKLDGGVALITLNRPQRLNALSNQLQEELWSVLDEVEKDDEVRALVFTGAPRPDGRPCFSAGADLKELSQQTERFSTGGIASIVRAMMDRGFEPKLAGVCSRMETMGMPSIAAVDGVCTAGGMELALACDIRVASETAQMSDLHIKNLGSIGGAGVSVRLARTVGPARAKEMMFTGEPLNGEQAVSIGLANHVFPPDKLVEGAVALARKFAAMRPQALAMAKAAMNAAMDLELEQALRYSYIGSAALPAGEGAKAFAQKQPPPHTRG
ncbi:MAG: enoyl-CoA hydratase/isomerase family protein [Dehalococcoidia bacterium]|mgnify:CR=1 FL=1|jgi:enoyl-CoA hydratase|nr:enoyl-CoA hydratase/isomerase family protein [Dehalococcoidia bacterium]MDP6510467.1 enoyl-CoA hydratase/isomerase family protein [Dehalococcoidia bacterium]MDP6782490.1 enoyl-CoA hydratase/isomerase family protein [Dehalococcoidia bacterium]